MDLRSLRYFLEIANAASFSAAAIRLHRSQSALSRCIIDLEAELGVPLFHREGRGVLLTPEGTALIGSIRELLKDADSVRERARLMQTGKTLVLRVGAAANTIERALPALMRRFRQRHPNVEFHLRPAGATALLEALERGEVDVAITRYVEAAFLGSEIAFPTHLLAIVGRGHKMATRSVFPIEMLANERLLVTPPTFTSRMILESAFAAARIRPRILLESHELNALVALAEAGQGVAVVPSTIQPPGHTLKYLPIQDGASPLGSWTGVLWDRRRASTQHVMQFVRQAVAQLRKNYPGQGMELPPLSAAH